MAVDSRFVQHWWDELERLARILGQVGPDEVCCEGLSQRQCAILRTLVAQEGARIQDLAASSGITPSAMTRVLEKLEQRGLLDQLMRERTEQIVESIPKAQREQILTALQTLNKAIESAGCCGLNAPVAKLTQIEEMK
jgi:DNA-binding MarR family transcriptional regulator